MTNSVTTTPSTPAFPVILRVYWMLLGNAALVLSVLNSNRFPSVLIHAGACALVVASIIAARYADIRYFNGLTADGEPATMQIFKRFAWRITGFGLILWLIAYGVVRAGII